MDFAFGSYTNDTLKIANHRAKRTGIQHRHAITPPDPAPGEAVTVDLVTSGDSGVEQVALYYTTDESIPQGSRGIAANGTLIAFEHVRTEWDSMTWDYLTHWQATIPAQADNTLVQYVISGWAESAREIYADWPDAEEQIKHAVMLYFENIPADSVFTPSSESAPTVFSYHVDTVQPPHWAKDAVIYQIFIDRFYPGDGADWIQTEDYRAFFGGTLWGVRDKLDYLADLGINCIWLSPTWVTPSTHGYDVADYDRVEPRYGGDDALRAVIEGAHQRGMRVLLDMVCNHISNEHPYFIDALNNVGSPYRDWFIFSDEYEAGYKGFFNVATMPELDFSHIPARDWMIANAVRWLRDYGVDGYRLDYANGAGPDFWTYFRRACKAENPDCLLFGEVIEPSDVLRHYYGRLDGCLDFPLNDALRRRYGWQVWNEPQFRAFLAHHTDYFSGDFVMPVFVDNHDMNRFSHIAGNDNDRLKQAVTVQMQQAQPVIILYGCEVGLQQPLNTREHGLDVCRVPMVWDERQDSDLLDFYRQQIAARKTRSEV